jgi:hypothetical protein
MGHSNNDLRPAWQPHLFIGSALLVQTFVDIDWPGPWQASFTTGTLGLIGCCLLYITWYRLTFERKGILPTTDLWKNPQRSVPQVAAVGIAFFILGWLAGEQLLDKVPAPAGMILTLLGLLIMLVAGYAWLVLLGPLQETMSSAEE